MAPVDHIIVVIVLGLLLSSSHCLKFPLQLLQFTRILHVLIHGLAIASTLLSVARLAVPPMSKGLMCSGVGLLDDLAGLYRSGSFLGIIRRRLGAFLELGQLRLAIRDSRDSGRIVL